LCMPRIPGSCNIPSNDPAHQLFCVVIRRVLMDWRKNTLAYYLSYYGTASDAD
jgi:hypothetical protein